LDPTVPGESSKFVNKTNAWGRNHKVVSLVYRVFSGPTRKKKPYWGNTFGTKRGGGAKKKRRIRTCPSGSVWERKRGKTCGKVHKKSKDVYSKAYSGQNAVGGGAQPCKEKKQSPTITGEKGGSKRGVSVIGS